MATAAAWLSAYHRRVLDLDELRRRARRSRPIGRLGRGALRVERRDGRLKLIRAARPARFSRIDRSSRRTPSSIEPRSQSERSCWFSSTTSPSSPRRAGAAGVVEQHQRQQRMHIRLVGHQRDQQRGPAGWRRRTAPADQVSPRGGRVALVEDQIDHRQHRVEPLGQQVIGRHLVGMRASRILRLARTSRCASVGSGTRKARATPAVDSPPSVRRVSATCASEVERRVAAGEDQPQPVGRFRFHRLTPLPASWARSSCSRVCVWCVRDAAGRGLRRAAVDNPGGRIPGHTLDRPVLDRGDEGFLEGVLGEIEVAKDANQRGQDPAVRLAKDQLDRVPRSALQTPANWNYGFQLPADCCHSGRISTEPFWACGIFAAQLIASSRSLQSKSQTPPSCSRVSANGPSVVRSCLAHADGRRRRGWLQALTGFHDTGLADLSGESRIGLAIF